MKPNDHERPDTAGRKRLGESGSRPASASEQSREAASPEDPPVVGFVSLGCVKNLVDSEKMLAQIAESGAILAPDESSADTVVVNTCGFLGAAREEALEVIEELAERKRDGTLRRIVVAGCLVQRDGQSLLQMVPEIDALVGVHNRKDVASAVWPKRKPDGGELYLGDYHAASVANWSDQGRLRLTPTHYAYVRMSEGCNQKCTFCTIPAIRGPLHCKPPERIVAECHEMLADGARELILIGQDTTSYGADISYEPGLAGLLRLLDQQCSAARWLRLMYVYPSIMTDEIIDAIAESERVVKYIDIPLQHINDRMLKRMNRRVTRKETEALLEKIRRRIPGVTIRTTFIVGFPGETEAEFEELLNFARDFEFDALGTFEYSLEPDTPAVRLPHQVDEQLKRERFERLMMAQEQLAIAAARRCVGRTFEVVVDVTGDEEEFALGRHAGQAPEVDSECWVPDDGTVEPGDCIQARCVDTDGIDLVVKRVE